MAQVLMYRTRFCPYCVMAGRLLRKKGVDFDEIDVSRDRERRAWLLEATGQGTVPQIFVGTRPIGGCDELHSLERSGELDELLAQAAAADRTPDGA
jgi:glutaredoxin 3